MTKILSLKLKNAQIDIVRLPGQTFDNWGQWCGQNKHFASILLEQLYDISLDYDRYLTFLCEGIDFKIKTL